MQDYYLYTPESAIASPEITVFLHPEQIITPKALKNAGHSPNAVIRLAESIKKYGILVPLAVKRTGKSGREERFELIDGERRLRAALIAGIDKIPCHILPESHRSCAIAGIIDQIRQKSLNFFEQAAAFRMLMQDFAMTQEEIARKTGFSQSAIANKLRLLQLSKEEEGRILAARLTERHARALLRLQDPKAREKALFLASREHLNVAATEELVETLLKSPKSESIHDPSAPHISVTLSPQAPPQGLIPRKFALKELTPLYNSIEHTLSIFRKTGAEAVCTREESADRIRIVIDIPRKPSDAP